MNGNSPFPAQPEKALCPAPGMQPPIREGELAVVVGAGASGQAAARLLRALGARVRLADSKTANITPAVSAMAREIGMSILAGPHNEVQFSGASLVVVSPGVPLAKIRPLLKAAGNPPLMAEMELALRYVSEPIVAVTGTSGKTTTVSLIAAMLEEAGKKVFLGGNIGIPLSTYVLKSDKADVLVLEMSSFQLQGSEHLRARVAALLNLTENHLDHHRDMAEYADAKFSIFAGQSPEDLAIVPAELLEEYKGRGCAARALVIGEADDFSHTWLLGAHNKANIRAAWLAAREMGVSREQAERAVAAFAPLPHRLEKVGESGGVVFVNDSKSTTVQALRAALLSFECPVYLLAGGKFKGGDLTSLRPLLAERVKAVALFGASREIFEEAWQGAAPLSWDASLPEAVARLRAQAAPGGAVLLSPATASFDLYANYTERGDHFRRIVAAFDGGAAGAPGGPGKTGAQNGAGGPDETGAQNGAGGPDETGAQNGAGAPGAKTR